MIFQQTLWKHEEIKAENIKRLSAEWGYEPIIVKLLLERGIETKEEAEVFLYPEVEHLHDPFLLEGMQAACDSIRLSMEKKENIWIFGDYDVDGITSIAVMIRCFEQLNYPVSYYIPHRQDEGYGLSLSGMDKLIDQKASLMITVDCGITAVEEIAYAKKKGLRCIVTDHHECHDELPDADAVINPKRGDYPFKMLAGCGVALKLAQALLGDEFLPFFDKVVDIVALGTIADIVPLVDENRIFARKGLERMPNTSNPGVQALLEEAQLRDKEVNSGHVGFVIAPRINASGRIGNPSISVEMLVEKDYYKALEIAKKLTELNTERQSQERLIYEEAVEYIEKNIDLTQEKLLIAVGEGWHSGIIGIVASKLVEKYSRPVIVMSKENGFVKGSARSVDGVSIFQLLSSQKHLMEKFGGHDQAAGLTVALEHFNHFKTSLLAYAKLHVEWAQLVPVQKVSGILHPKMINHQLIEKIEQLKPFGMGNSKPQFSFYDLTIETFKAIGKEQSHLKLQVFDGMRLYDALAFNRADLIGRLNRKESIHLLIHLEKNSFMGVEKIQFLVKDMMKAELPFKREIHMLKSIAIVNYIFALENILEMNRMQLKENFDWILSEKIEKPLLIYKEETLEAFKNWSIENQFENYCLFFNKKEAKLNQESTLEVIFMPYAQSLHSEEKYIVLRSDYEKFSLQNYIPKRDEMAKIYKNLLNQVLVDIEVIQKATSYSAEKIMISFMLLKEMGLIEFEKMNQYIHIQFLPKPKEKMDLQGMEIYQNIVKKYQGGY